MSAITNPCPTETTTEMPHFYVSLTDGLDLARLVMCYQSHITEMNERLDNDDIDGASKLASDAGQIEVEYLTLAKRMLEAENAGHVLYQTSGSWKCDEEDAWKELQAAIIDKLCDEMPDDISVFDDDTIEELTNDYYASSITPEDLGKYDVVNAYFDRLPYKLSCHVYEYAHEAWTAFLRYGASDESYEFWFHRLHEKVNEIVYKNTSLDEDVVSDAVHETCEKLIAIAGDDDHIHYVSDEEVLDIYRSNLA